MLALPVDCVGGARGEGAFGGRGVLCDHEHVPYFGADTIPGGVEGRGGVVAGDFGL